MDTVEGLGDAARLARGCAVMGHAVTLARWIGTGRRPVTRGRVLRKADVPAAGAALGVEVPTRLRTMADIRELHRPWCVAVATGLLQVGDGWVTAGPALERWPPGDADLLAGWLAGLRAVCAAESYPQDEDSVRLLALALLTVLGENGARGADGLWHQVLEVLQVLGDRYDKWSWESVAAADRYGDPYSGKPLARAVAEFAASGASRSIDQVAQLKMSLAGFRPVIWRRVLLPATATLGDLHVVIQVLFGWDGDHLHEFTVGKKRYADPFVNLEETGDKDAVRIRDAMVPGGSIAYTYDFGASWEHEITLERTLPRDHSQDYPVCVAFRGDSPVEYWSEEEPEDPRPFGLTEVNRRLAALGREPA